MNAAQRSFYRTTIGKKMVMAVSGLVLVGFVLGHLLGNLQIFLELTGPNNGRHALNSYAHLLHSLPALLWGTRILLIVAVVAHFLSAFALIQQNRRARPQGYRVTTYQKTSFAARTLRWGGVIILAFIVYHIGHLTLGMLKPGLERVAGGALAVDGYGHIDVYANVIRGFQVEWVAAAYIVANGLLGFHLYHGVWSMLQTLGVSHSVLNDNRRDRRKLAAAFFGLFVAAGNISIPVAVLAGYLK